MRAAVLKTASLSDGFTGLRSGFRSETGRVHSRHDAGAERLQVLLDKAGTQVHVDLYQRRITNRLEAVDLARLDDKDISSATLEGLAVDRPHSASFANELDLVIGMAMGTRPGAGLPVEQEHRNTGVTLYRADKLMRTTNKRKVLLPHVEHSCHPPGRWMSVAGVRLRECDLWARGRRVHFHEQGCRESWE